MTALLEAPTATSPTVRSEWRRHRSVVALVSALVLVLVLVALLTGVGSSGLLDPRSYEPTGARALATLLEQRGVRVTVTEDVPTTVDGADDRTVLLVPTPALLSAEELEALAESDGTLVVLEGGPEVVVALGVAAEVTGGEDSDDLSPSCDLAVARAAGRARAGGYAYTSADNDAVGCYPVKGGSSLLSVPAEDVVLLGSGEGLTNERLDEQGNAALGLGLLGDADEVRWLLPAADRDVLGTAPATSLTDLLPDWVKLAVVQLFVALAVLALWRARRLGRVVVEPLPVVVRAAETVEGRGRLYRAASSRGTAADALRAGARDRLARRLGAGRQADPASLTALVASRSSFSPAQVQALLYGPAPADDAALVRLADDLDALTDTLVLDTPEVAGS